MLILHYLVPMPTSSSAGVTSSTSSRSSTGLCLYMSTYAVNCLAIYYVNSSLLSAYAYKFLCGGYIFNIFEVFNRSVPIYVYICCVLVSYIMLILHYLVPMPSHSSMGVISSTSSRSSTGLYLRMSTYAVN